MLRVTVIPLALIAMLAGAVFWSGGGVEQRADFAFINRGDIFTLDLNQMSYMQDFRLTYGIREGLYDLDPKSFRPIPAGALQYQQSEDKKQWTFKLRKECRWSNNDPVTARDYVFSWRRLLEEPGEYTYLYYYIHNAKPYAKSFAKGAPIDFKTVGMQAVNDHELRVTLDDPVPYLLELLAFPPFYPRHERSMAPFRIYTDTDVMDVFARYVAAARGDRREKGFDSPAGAKWIEFTRSFEPAKATEAELLQALKLFSAMSPLAGLPATKVDKLAENAEEEGPNEMDPLTPEQKLSRMLEKGFIRYTYNKAYTLPPDAVTNGPFVLKRWDFKRRLLLDKSQTYWDREHVKSNSIEMVVAENPQSQLLLYETGQVDWQSDVIGEQAAELKKLGRTDLRTSPAFGTAFLTLLCTDKLPASLGGGDNPLANVKVRQALAMAVDKRFVVKNITRMDELPARTYLPPDGTLPDFTWLPGPYDNGRTEPYTFAEMQKRLRLEDGLTGAGPGLPYDVSRARQLLAEAGYPGGKGFPSLPILFNTNSPTRRDICQVLKQQWKQALNIDIQIQGVEGKIFSRRITNKDYWIGTVAWYGDYPDVSTFTDKYTSGSLLNDSAWKNVEYDKLCADAQREPDENKRLALLSRAEHLIDTQMPIIPMYHYVNLSMSRDNVRGVTPNPRNITIFKNVWVDRGGK